MCSYLQAVKCGYCGWIMFGSCEDIVSHDCFKNYNECIHVLVVDEKGRATMSNFICKQIFFNIYLQILNIFNSFMYKQE